MDDNELLLEDIDILSLIQEAPGDEGEGGNAEGGGETVDAGADNTDNTDKNADNADQNTDNNDQQNNENKGDQENDENFDIDTEADDNPDDAGGDEEGGGEENTAPEEGEAEVSDEEKEKNAIYDKVYEELSPAERARMDSVLRKQYKELFNQVDAIISNTTYFPNTNDSNKVVKLLMRSLRDFKEYILYYMTDIYSTKSHLENRIKYEEFLQVFNGINHIYKDLETALSHKDEDIDRKE